ncbi:hypothetical protein H0H92_002301 [Tricholoma furcatifolium]|nr:hypothetical protein H0H92_002301 [Tricholoma furcatifolium]
MAWRGSKIKEHDKSGTFQVAPIKVERRRTPFSYRTYEMPHPDNNSIDGQFGIYKKKEHTKLRLRNFLIGHAQSFMAQEQALVDDKSEDEDGEIWKKIKEKPIEDVKGAGSERCFFTGRDHGLVVVWIVPPVLCEKLNLEGENSLATAPAQAEKHQISANTITIGTEFEYLFRNNEIMVDVDKDPNELHVLCFKASSLPTRSFNLQQRDTIDSGTLFYLKIHSFCGVLRGTMGGGMGEDHGLNNIYRYISETPAKDLTLKRIRRKYQEMDGLLDTSHLESIFQWLAARKQRSVPAICEEGGPEEVSEPSEDESADDTDDDTDAKK